MSGTWNTRFRGLGFVLRTIWICFALYHQFQGEYARAAMCVAWACYIKVIEPTPGSGTR